MEDQTEGRTEDLMETQEILTQAEIIMAVDVETTTSGKNVGRK
ncbi:MAG: hypothetical protein Aurels2KO_58230 [Aureliella sp.]